MRPRTTGRGRGSGGREVRAWVSAEEYRTIADAAARMECPVGTAVRIGVLDLAHRVRHGEEPPRG